MPVSAETLRLLMDHGLAGDDLITVVASIDADAGPKPRSSGAIRQARYRAKRQETVTSDVTRDVTESVTPGTPLARVEDNSPNKVIEPQGKKEPTGRHDLAEFRAELAPDLDTDRVEALVKLRRTKKGQLTGYAAKLFRRDASTCHLTLAEAADTCISRNWITVKPDWLAKPSRDGPAPTKRTNLADYINKLQSHEPEPSQAVILNLPARAIG